MSSSRICSMKPPLNGSTALKDLDKQLSVALEKSEHVLSHYSGSKREEKRRLPTLANTVGTTIGSNSNSLSLKKQLSLDDHYDSDSSDSDFESKDDITFSTSPKPNWTHIRHPSKKSKNNMTSVPSEQKQSDATESWSLEYIHNEGCNKGHLVYKNSSSAAPPGSAKASHPCPPQYIHLEHNTSRVVILHGTRVKQPSCYNIIADVSYSSGDISVRVPVIDSNTGKDSNCGCWTSLDPHQKKESYSLTNKVLDRMQQEGGSSGVQILSSQNGSLRKSLVRQTSLPLLEDQSVQTRLNRRLPSPPPFPSPILNCSDVSNCDHIRTSTPINIFAQKQPFISTSTEYQTAPGFTHGKESSAKYLFDSVQYPKSIGNKKDEEKAVISTVIETSPELASEPSTSSISSADTIQDELPKVPLDEVQPQKDATKVYEVSAKAAVPSAAEESIAAIEGEDNENTPTLNPSSPRPALHTIANSNSNSSEEEPSTHEPVTSARSLTTISELSKSSSDVTTTSGTEVKPIVAGGRMTQKKWKKAGLMLKTGLTFKDAGKVQQLKKMYYQMKNDSITYFHALAKDNPCEDEDPFILQHYNNNEIKKKQNSAQSQAQSDAEAFIIDPAGDLYFLTQGLVTIAMLFNLVSCILRMSFDEVEEQMGVKVFFSESFFDLVYLFDFFIHFRTGYLDDGILVTDLENIRNNYMKSEHFTYDVLSVVPLCISYGLAKAFSQLLFGIVTRGPLFDDGLFYSLVTGEAVLRVAKLAKFFSMRRFFDMFGSRTNSPGMMRALCLILYLLLSIHWVACLYYTISEHEGFGLNTWVFPLYPEGDYNNQFYRKYIQCFYWAFLTLTTIGGPEQPETTLEYIVTCITFLLGIFIFAAVVGNVGDAITSMNESKTTYQKRADAIKLYMQHHGVPDVLQKKVKKWLEYSWMRTQGADEQSLMDALPERLRARIAIQIHVKTLKKVKIFENCEHGLLCELVLKLRPQIFSPGDYICRIGEIGKEMFIICHGKVECIITLPSGERKTVAVLEAGKSFGEIALLGVEGCSRRTADVRSIGYSELLSLSKKALTQALEDYPEARKQLEAEGKNRLGKGQSKQMPHKYQKEGDSDSDGEDKGADSPDNKSLTKLLHELKAFDSLKHKSTVKDLEEEKETLQAKLDKKVAELEEANRLIRQFAGSKEEIDNILESRQKNGKPLRQKSLEDS